VMCTRACRGYGMGTKLGEVLPLALGLVRRHRVSIDANYMTLVINAMCLEGMAAKLEPHYNVLDAARPLLSVYRRVPRSLFRVLSPALGMLKRARDRRMTRCLMNHEIKKDCTR